MGSAEIALILPNVGNEYQNEWAEVAVGGIATTPRAHQRGTGPSGLWPTGQMRGDDWAWDALQLRDTVDDHH